MYPYIKCPTCNKLLGDKYELYLKMKEQLYSEKTGKLPDNLHSYNNISYNNIDIKTKEIFDILNITNYCCKIKMMTNIEFKSLLFA